MKNLFLVFTIVSLQLNAQLEKVELDKFNFEYHDNDSIVRIGDALYNVVTDEVIGFSFSEESIDDIEEELSSKFLSIDPYYRAFSMLTPYQFASNTPISAIDLDGYESLDYRVIAVDENGNALVNIKIASGSTSRDNGGALMFNNLGSGVSGTSTESKKLDLALGTQYNGESMKHRNVTEQLSSGAFTFNPTKGTSEYTFSMQAIDREASGVEYFQLPGKSSGVGDSDHQLANGVKVLSLIVPPDDAPIGDASKNVDAPGTYGGTTSNFMKSVEAMAKEAFNEVKQTSEDIKKVTITIPNVPDYSKKQAEIKAMYEVKYKNAEVNVVLGTSDIADMPDYNLEVEMVGSEKQNLKVSK